MSERFRFKPEEVFKGAGDFAGFIEEQVSVCRYLAVQADLHRRDAEKLTGNARHLELELYQRVKSLLAAIERGDHYREEELDRRSEGR